MWYSEGGAKFQRRSPAGVRVGYSANDCASGLGTNGAVKQGSGVKKGGAYESALSTGVFHEQSWKGQVVGAY